MSGAAEAWPWRRPRVGIPLVWSCELWDVRRLLKVCDALYRFSESVQVSCERHELCLRAVGLEGLGALDVRVELKSLVGDAQVLKRQHAWVVSSSMLKLHLHQGAKRTSVFLGGTECGQLWLWTLSEDPPAVRLDVADAFDLRASQTVLCVDSQRLLSSGRAVCRLSFMRSFLNEHLSRLCLAASVCGRSEISWSQIEGFAWEVYSDVGSRLRVSVPDPQGSVASLISVKNFERGSESSSVVGSSLSEASTSNLSLNRYGFFERGSGVLCCRVFLRYLRDVLPLLSMDPQRDQVQLTFTDQVLVLDLAVSAHVRVSVGVSSLDAIDLQSYLVSPDI